MVVTMPNLTPDDKDSKKRTTVGMRNVFNQMMLGLKNVYQ